MATVCIQRPNRTKRRYFSSCDAARIAREVVRDDTETTPEEVMACIAKGFGFTHVSLSRTTVVESSILTKIPVKPTLTILQKLIEALIRKYPWLKTGTGPIIVALKRAIELADKVDILEPPQAEVDKVINKEKCKCKDQPTPKEMTHGK